MYRIIHAYAIIAGCVSLVLTVTAPQYYEIDPQLLKKEERQSLELLRLKGLGYKTCLF